MAISTEKLEFEEQTRSSGPLSDEQLRILNEQGFVTLPSIAPAADVAKIDATIKDLLARKVGFKEGARRDLVDPDDGPGSDKLTELVWPHNYAPSLHKSDYFKAALAIARQVLGPDATFAFDHAIFKPPHHGAETPWHQDEAYQTDLDRGRQQVAIWMPTSEVTPANGCMRYIPRSHMIGVLAHQPLNRDERIHGLQCIGAFNPADAVHCSMPAGGAVIHAGRTLHSAGPNLTAHPRLAYILVFAGPPRREGAPRDFEWHNRRQETSARRRRQWLRRGGAVIEFVRHARRYRYYDPVTLIRRVARVLRRSD
ncbi:phytanoyl-CoA dioxygenase family protein [Paraburkholderia sp. GAS334]|uniref:phytanoyl-CoA dioxygenase family protein n=1 Tax=unclassified Paraburkholderia TaxID=2615204 RepID=UPI003D224398